MGKLITKNPLTNELVTLTNFKTISDGFAPTPTQSIKLYNPNEDMDFINLQVALRDDAIEGDYYKIVVCYCNDLNEVHSIDIDGVYIRAWNSDTLNSLKVHNYTIEGTYNSANIGNEDELLQYAIIYIPSSYFDSHEFFPYSLIGRDAYYNTLKYFYSNMPIDFDYECDKYVKYFDTEGQQIKVSVLGCFKDCTYLKTIPPQLIVDAGFKNLFYCCYSLEYIPTGIINSETTDIRYMFYSCYNLKAIPWMGDCVNLQDIYGAFSETYNLGYVYMDSANIYPIDSSNSIFPLKFNKLVTAEYCFSDSGITIAQTFRNVNTDDTISMRSAYFGCKNLKSITLDINYDKLSGIVENCFALKNIEVEGVLIEKQRLDFSTCYVLSVQSVVNVFNGLDTTTSGTIRLYSGTLKLLNDEQIGIAINKGWIVE